MIIHANRIPTAFSLSLDPIESQEATFNILSKSTLPRLYRFIFNPWSGGVDTMTAASREESE